MQKKLEKN